MVRLSLHTLQRRSALRDALRHTSAPRRILKTGRGASRTACDAERRTMVRLSLRTLQRRNALRDALRHNSAPRRILKIGRRASHDSEVIVAHIISTLVIALYVGIYNPY